MLVIGGTYSNDTTFMCDTESVWGEHNMGLSQENPDNDIWAEYFPSLTTYTVPTFIRTAVGGEATGGAEVTVPVSGFAAPELSVLMTRKASITVRTPTRDVSMATGSSSGNGTETSSPVLSPGAIAGISVGGTITVIAILAGCCCLIRRRQKHYQEPRLPGHNLSSTVWGSSVPSAPSPAVTQATYVHPIQSPVMLPSMPFYPPAELPADGQRYLAARSVTGSPSSVKYGTSPWSNAQLVDAHVPSPSRSPRSLYRDHQERGPTPGTPYWASPTPTPQRQDQAPSFSVPRPAAGSSWLIVPRDQNERDERGRGSGSRRGSIHQGSIM